MKQELKTITPETAREMLKHNTINRPLSKKNIDFLVKEIKDGRWKVTHQGIGLAKDGTLLDGQHRLHAIIKADQAVDVMVTSGLDKALFKFIDVGKKRGSDDIFSIEGFKYPKELPGLIKKILLWSDGVALNIKDSNRNIDDLLDFAVMNQVDLYDAINASWRNVKSVYPKACASFMYWICYKKGPALVDLMDQVVTGKTIDPYLISLRDELIDNQIRRLTTDHHTLICKTLHAFHCSLAGKKKRMPEITSTTARDIYQEIQKELK